MLKILASWRGGPFFSINLALSVINVKLFEIFTDLIKLDGIYSTTETSDDPNAIMDYINYYHTLSNYASHKLLGPSIGKFNPIDKLYNFVDHFIWSADLLAHLLDDEAKELIAECDTIIEDTIGLYASINSLILSYDKYKKEFTDDNLLFIAVSYGANMTNCIEKYEAIITKFVNLKECDRELRARTYNFLCLVGQGTMVEAYNLFMKSELASKEDFAYNLVNKGMLPFIQYFEDDEKDEGYNF